MTAIRSIRMRLTAWYSAMLLAALLALCAFLWVAVDRAVMASTDARLQERIAGLEVLLNSEDGSGPPAQVREEVAEYAAAVPEGGLVSVRFVNGAALLMPRNPRLGAGVHAGFTDIRDGAHGYRFLSEKFNSHGRALVLTAGTALSNVEDLLAAFRAVLLWAVPIIVVLATAGGYAMSRRALAPVATLTEAARAIGASNLSERLPLRGTGDELDRLAAAWNEMLARLENAFERIGRFTADAAHELRSPVAVIQTAAELALRKPRGAEEYREALRRVEREAVHTGEVLAGLLTLARADAAPGVQFEGTADLDTIVAEAVAEQETRAAVNGVALSVRHAGEPAVVKGDALQLRRLLTILLDNALKYSAERGAVEVATAADENGVRLVVRDSGEGITREDLPHIFERFYRADKARDRNGGAGLGLAIAKTIAEAHGGRIEASSEVGHGAVFAVVFPRARRVQCDVIC